MRYDTPSKVVIQFRNIDAATGLFEALKYWARKAGAGGDAAIMFGDGYKGRGEEARGIICGVVGHDVLIKEIDITHEIKDSLASDPMLKPSDVRKYLNISPSTLRRLVLDGSIPALRVGHTFRFLKNDLLEFVNNRTGKKA